MNFGSIPLKTRLPIVIFGVGLLVALIVGSVAYIEISSLAQKDLQATISALLDSRKTAVERFYANIASNIADMSGSPLAIAGFRRLQLGWQSEGADPATALTEDYISNNPNPADQRMNLDRAKSFRTYNDQHAQFHPAFRKWINLHGYPDLFLIDLDGNIIFSVNKGRDFASNLISGPDANGPLAAAFTAAKSDRSFAVHFSDFAHYGPSNGTPAAFAAQAIRSEDGNIVGIFAIKLAEKNLNAVLDDPNGLGRTGEVLLVGPDGAARSASRFSGRFGMLDQLPSLPQLAVNANTDPTVKEHAKLTSGDIGAAMAMKMDIVGVDYTLLVEIADSEIYANVGSARNLLVLWALGAASLLTGIGIYLAKDIVKPITRVSTAIRAIASGDLMIEVADIERSDEVGDIAKSLDALREKLKLANESEKKRHCKSDEQKQIVEALTVGLRELATGNLALSIDVAFGDHEMLRHDFNQTVERLSETISMVLATADSITSRAREISQSSEDLSARIETQATTLQETAAALDQLTCSVKSAAEGAKEVETIVRSARNEAEDSGKVVQGAVGAMTEIARSSDQIAQIIGVIDDIAFQTSLLALNAGVEAARAGDAGRGFAVVASEVRALAQRSSAAAKEIKTLIRASTQQVGRGVEQVGRAGDALANIAKRVNHISTLVSSIASAATEQSTGLAEINLGVAQLDQVTQQNAAMVAQSSVASQSMSQQVAGLSDLVSQFQVRRLPERAGGPAYTAMSALPGQTAPTAKAALRDPKVANATFRSSAVPTTRWQDF